MKHTLCVLFLLSTIALEGAEKLKWPKGLSSSDKRDVLALAARIGISDVGKVQGIEMEGGRCLWVEGRPLEIARERRWSYACLFRDTWREYESYPIDPDAIRVGRWVSSGGIGTARRQFRIQDRAWNVFINVPTEGKAAAVEYDDVKKIVLAIRQRTLINWQAPSNGPGLATPPQSILDASRISILRKGDESDAVWLSDTPSLLDSDFYAVHCLAGDNEGLELLVRVRPDGVELLRALWFVI
jgi:hypothetical protein